MLSDGQIGPDTESAKGGREQKLLLDAPEERRIGATSALGSAAAPRRLRTSAHALSDKRTLMLPQATVARRTAAASTAAAGRKRRVAMETQLTRHGAAAAARARGVALQCSSLGLNLSELPHLSGS